MTTEPFNLDIGFLCDPFFGGCHACGAPAIRKLDDCCTKCGHTSAPLCADPACYDAIMAGREPTKLTGMGRMFSHSYREKHPHIVVPGYEEE